jgi:DNA gyrase subunit A
VALYRAQRRGGRGKVGAAVRDEDFVEHLFVASTHSYLLFFTTKGRVHWRKVHEIPQAGRAARGKAIVNLLNLGPDEKVSAFLPVREFQPDRFIVFATRQGLIKKTDLMAYANPRPSGIIAIALEDDDEVIGVRMVDGTRELILSTRSGQAIRFRETDVRPMGRGTYGVRGITLEEGDAVVAMDVAEAGATLLAVSENGYGKRSAMEDYRLQGRGGKGIITMKTTEKTGQVAGVVMVTDDDQVILVTDRGKVIRIRMSEIRVIGRNTQGVRLIEHEEGERVSSVARLAEREDGDVGAGPEEDGEPAPSLETDDSAGNGTE